MHPTKVYIMASYLHCKIQRIWKNQWKCEQIRPGTSNLHLFEILQTQIETRSWWSCGQLSIPLVHNFFLLTHFAISWFQRLFQSHEEKKDVQSIGRIVHNLLLNLLLHYGDCQIKEQIYTGCPTNSGTLNFHWYFVDILKNKHILISSDKTLSSGRYDIGIIISEDNVWSDEIKICNIFEYQSNENWAFRFFGTPGIHIRITIYYITFSFIAWICSKSSLIYK